LKSQATRLARALQASGVERGDRVAYMVPNIPEMLVANFGVPLAGAVLVATITRHAVLHVEIARDTKHRSSLIFLINTYHHHRVSQVRTAMPRIIFRGSENKDVTTAIGVSL
jgi:fatty-acyl-CoA synthase